MATKATGDAAESHDAVVSRVRALTAGIRERAAAAEEARTVPRESIDELFAAGITRILVPPRLGGYGLGLDTWFEVVREIGKADASHAWCGSLMIHHPHYISQFAEARSRRSGPTGSTSPLPLRSCPRPASCRWTAATKSPASSRLPAASIIADG